jgi:hypothetical protein
MSSNKIYVGRDKNGDIVKFSTNDNSITSTGKKTESELSFIELQHALIVEVTVTKGKSDVCYINPYSGNFIRDANTSTTNMDEAEMVWKQQTGDSWQLVNWSYNDTVVTITFEDVQTNPIRIIWANRSLVILYDLGLFDNTSFFVNKAEQFLHESIVKMEDERKAILQKEIQLINVNNVPRKKLLIITAGSQAAGKSAYLEYRPTTNESIATYDNQIYYNVDSDRYIELFSIVRALNNIPISYANYSGKCVNSILEMSALASMLQDPHKNVEYEIEQYCLNNGVNFIKQGTSLWLTHMAENRNYIDFSKMILFFWINISQMEARLNSRLSNTVNVRYFFPVQESIDNYNLDWYNIAKQIIVDHYDNIFKGNNSYNFCFIFNDIPSESREGMSCFDNKFNILKPGIMTPAFFIRLMCYLSDESHKLSDISKETLVNNDAEKLPVVGPIKEKMEALIRLMSSQPIQKKGMDPRQIVAKDNATDMQVEPIKSPAASESKSAERTDPGALDGGKKKRRSTNAKLRKGRSTRKGKSTRKGMGVRTRKNKNPRKPKK